MDNDPVLNNGSVAVVDTATNAVLTRVSLPAFHTARRVAIIPDGTRGYVTINTPQGVIVFDTATNVVKDEIPIQGIPEGIAVTPAPSESANPLAALTARLKVHPNRHALSATGTFVLGSETDGIHPESEVVRLSIADTKGVILEEALPAGSFQRIARGSAIFHSAKNRSGIQLMRITAKGSVVSTISECLRSHRSWTFRVSRA